MNAGVVTIQTGGGTSASADTSRITAGTVLDAWTDVSITLRAEGFPNDWRLTASAESPVDGAELDIREGESCTIHIDDDVVVSGYVDRVAYSGAERAHALALMGRGKTQDLVDCSAEWDAGGQIMAATALEIAAKLAAPYGINVRLADGAKAGPQVPQFNLTYGETAADIIQRVARNAALMAYEDADGDLLLARVGTATAASGIVYGRNVERYAVTYSADQRMSEIVCASNTIDITADTGEGGFFFHTERDLQVRRHRLLYLTLLQAADARPLTIAKAQWEVARRAGRGTAVTVTVDSWRDDGGRLWLPNTLVDVDLPGMRSIEPLCIAEVTFQRSGESGTTADLYLLPRGAFTPEPISLAPANLLDIDPVAP